MKKTRFTEDPARDRCRPIADVAKKHGLSDATIYAWRKRYRQLESTDVKRLRQAD